jgi:hypothetical protein
MGLGPFWAIFFENSSGHADSDGGANWDKAPKTFYFT